MAYPQRGPAIELLLHGPRREWKHTQHVSRQDNEQIDSNWILTSCRNRPVQNDRLSRSASTETLILRTYGNTPTVTRLKRGRVTLTTLLQFVGHSVLITECWLCMMLANGNNTQLHLAARLWSLFVSPWIVFNCFTHFAARFDLCFFMNCIWWFCFMYKWTDALPFQIVHPLLCLCFFSCFVT
jgi:hypothetical protein